MRTLTLVLTNLYAGKDLGYDVVEDYNGKAQVSATSNASSENLA